MKKYLMFSSIEEPTWASVCLFLVLMQTHICRAAGRGHIRPPRPSRAVVAASLAAEAPPEDHFDWTVLGFQGPWIPLSSTHENASEPITQIQNQSPLSLRFSSTSDYITSFQGLVLKEAKAFLLTSWDEYVAEQNPDVEPKDLSTQGVSMSPSLKNLSNR
jgi:hypothetical protein